MLLRVLTLGFLLTAAACASHPQLEDAGRPDAATPDASVTVPDAGHSLCVDGGTYPPGPYDLSLLSTAPDLALDGIDEQGRPAHIALHDYFEPCAARSRLLVVRTSGAWCGLCRWDAAHTSELSSDAGERVVWLELLVGNDDNAPPGMPDLAAWQQRVDRPARVAADTAFSFGPADFIHEALPLVVLIDTRTMSIRSASGNNTPDLLAWQIRAELARLDGDAAPPVPSPMMFDGLFERRQWELIQDMKMPGAPPADPTNAVADVAAAADLGKQLFSDASLSPTGTVSCATCHDPAKHFADGLPTSQGVAAGDRNAPSVLFASQARWQFWDGRADTLWMQALGPFENPKEFNSSRLFVAHAIFDRYKSSYEALFGAMPLLSDGSRFPAAGKPGDTAWDTMAPADQDAATRVYVNAGKAIAAYERALRAMPDRLDAYARGDLTALTATEKNGLKAFFVTGCPQCHWGPRLTDDAFHDVRFPTGRQDAMADRGRIDGVPQYLASPFTGAGVFSDSSDAGLSPLAAPSMLGAFKTPPLRGVADTAPYGHGGSLATLSIVAGTYGTAGLAPTDTRAVGDTEPWVGMFTPNHIGELVPFLEALTATPAP